MSRHETFEPPSIAVDPLIDRRPRSLVVQVARKMLLWACVNTLVLTAIGYAFVSHKAEQRSLSYLNGYLTQRLRSEGRVFAQAEANLDRFEVLFRSEYRDPRVLETDRFYDYFEPKPDGSLRLRERFYAGSVDGSGLHRSNLTGFLVHARPAPTPELRRRMMLAYELVSSLGPAWSPGFANLYAAVPENGGVVYWPGVPWGLDVPTSRPTTRIAKPWWSSLYFDAVARRWNVSYQRPIVEKGRSILYPGQDILLDELVGRLASDRPDGAHNLILSDAGQLIADPSRLHLIQRSAQGLDLASLGDAELTSVFRSIKAQPPSGRAGKVQIVYDAEVDAYLGYGRLEGPGWWFVTVYPRALVTRTAHEAANGLLILGFGSFALMTLVVVWVLRDRVSRPISQMRLASETVSRGDYAKVAEGGVELPVGEDNEIGLFACSFRSMAGKVGDAHRLLEETVIARTSELQRANRELERLSLRDALTGAFNRRKFDRDLRDAISRAGGKGAEWLLVCDVDHFKLYNDRYGHPAGDAVLQAVAGAISRNAAGASVYRYGGEEMAIIFPAETPQLAERIASDIVRSVEQLAIEHSASPLAIVTMSAGLAQITAGVASAEDAVAAADARLYEAKRRGRNRLCASA